MEASSGGLFLPMGKDSLWQATVITETIESSISLLDVLLNLLKVLIASDFTLQSWESKHCMLVHLPTCKKFVNVYVLLLMSLISKKFAKVKVSKINAFHACAFAHL